ncbi:hypothetical protein RSSM_02530 [Rhodopirellula sallentina SM41]|uniref:Uncharacterized protein n=1 Tax=Rhodopirellula sallentina SM41 TaxID=1263870 RepID=M5U3K1_9BACT|nr:hypothetical protein RSSM_02530 [Rhodopirellula sallentina SM41]
MISVQLACLAGVPSGPLQDSGTAGTGRATEATKESVPVRLIDLFRDICLST